LNSSIRKKLIALHYKKQSIHLGSSLSCIDIISSILLELKIPFRDFILSKGHASTALYVCLNELGVISNSLLDSYYENGTHLTAHPIFESGFVDFSTGSLGHGISLAAGKCMARKFQEVEAPVFCLVSDGEMNEGSVYEGINFAVQHKLNNLYVIVDNNGFQGLGHGSEVLGDLTQTFATRKGLNYVEIDGHNSSEIKIALNCTSSYPTLINAKTIKGKGVDFAENDNNWHYNKLSREQYHNALSKL
tara:strand:+ start:3817 stop:4557 length:741 start_codon:yes stop_codon:yes gene_type:complete